MVYMKYGPEEEIRIMTIHLYLKTDEVKGQMSAYKEYGKIHGLKFHSFLKKVSFRVIYGNENERRNSIKKKKTLNTYTIENFKSQHFL